MYQNAVKLKPCGSPFQHPYQIRIQPNKQTGSRLHGRDDDTAKGFTLIELLVVILIIGILSAVALPQYQRAVEKSRATEPLALMRRVAEAARLYHLSNGSYPPSLDDLDITIPYPKVNDSTYANSEWKLTFYPQDNVMGYSLRMLRVKGKYRDNGFHYFIGRDKSGLSGLYCLEYWTPNTYCVKALGLKDPIRLSGYGHFTRMYVYSL